jgi:phage/plasmid-like protein (TIGR03299 family)
MHELETGFFVKEPAWHRLGTVINEAPSIEEGLKLAGLDWQVVEMPISLTGSPDVISSHKALVRTTDQSVLGVVGKGYTPLQNVEAFSWFDFLIDQDIATLEAAGSLKEGKKIWILARFKEEAEVIKGDPIHPYILLANSHDGMMGVNNSNY